MIKKITTVMLCVFLMTMGAMTSSAETPVIQKYISNAEKKGDAHLKYLMWDVYDASLFVPKGNYSATGPMALKLDYLIGLKGQKIADRSVDEIRKQGFSDETKLKNWQGQMAKIFPDVSKGTSITGIRDKSGNAIFYKNSSKIGEIKDPEFAQKFFDIWLSEKTSEPKMRQQLLGLK